MLPQILKYLRRAFCNDPIEAREEAIQEAVVNTCVAYARLVERGAEQRAFPTVLARFAVAQVRQGRRVGGRQNVRDVLSPCALRKQRCLVERLDRYDTEEQAWREAVVEDPYTPVFDQVWFRIDFPQWLAGLAPRKRRIAETLAVGHSTAAVAQQFGLSAARISQLRRELYESWRGFHGE
jgi:RNA polymerase sigma factor (sigma-70 family)